MTLVSRCCFISLGFRINAFLQQYCIQNIATEKIEIMMRQIFEILCCKIFATIFQKLLKLFQVGFFTHQNKRKIVFNVV